MRGRVVDGEGRAIPTARVWLSDYGNDSEGAVVTVVEPDGSFSIANVGESRHIGAIADEWCPSHLMDVDKLPLGEDGVPWAELVLSEPGAGLDLTVVDAAGRPAAGAWVKAVSPSVSLRSGGVLRRVRTASREGRTDQQGRWGGARASGLGWPAGPRRRQRPP